VQVPLASTKNSIYNKGNIVPLLIALSLPVGDIIHQISVMVNYQAFHLV